VAQPFFNSANPENSPTLTQNRLSFSDCMSIFQQFTDQHKWLVPEKFFLSPRTVTFMETEFMKLVEKP